MGTLGILELKKMVEMVSVEMLAGGGAERKWGRQRGGEAENHGGGEFDRPASNQPPHLTSTLAATERGKIFATQKYFNTGTN